MELAKFFKPTIPIRYDVVSAKIPALKNKIQIQILEQNFLILKQFLPVPMAKQTANKYGPQ